MAINSPIVMILIEAFSYSKNRNGGVSLNLLIFKRFEEETKCDKKNQNLLE